MQYIGKGLHIVAKGRLVIEASDVVKPRTHLYDGRKRPAGTVEEVLGPVGTPFLLVAPARGVRATRLVGRELFRR